MDDLNSFPGFLGGTSGVIEVIHADWPVYPAGYGWEIALISFGQFPESTVFHFIDDIDQCILFLTEDPKMVENPLHHKHFHVAAWHDDLLPEFDKAIHN